MFRSALTLLANVINVALIASAATAAHPFHVSIAQAKYNAESKNLEVALRVHPGDLETMLRRRTGKPINIDKTEKVDELIVAYLKEVFQVKPGGKEAVELKWVGKQVDVKHAWLFFECPLPEGTTDVEFSNRIFFEILSDQVNTINLEDGDYKKSLNCTKDRPSAIIRAAEK